MKSIRLVTGNREKIREISFLLAKYGIKVIPMIAGELEDVLEQFVMGHLVSSPLSFSQRAKSGRYGLRKGKCRRGRRDIT